MMKNISTGDSRGVALVTALFVLLVMTILGVGMLMNVYENLKISKNAENSERALKIAESGVQIARASFFDPKRPEINATQRLFSVDGFIRGGYFLTRMVSGFAGNEKWVQWHYDPAVTGYNTESKITYPVRRVWATSAPGQNGDWDGMFYVNNIYGVVAKGVYFPIQYNTGSTIETKVRAHNEFTGVQDIGFWKEDKVLTNATLTPTVGYADLMSPMSTFSNYSTGWGDPEPTLLNQTLYFTYAGSSSTMTNTDQSSTVRLRAANARCNSGANNESLSTLWEFDTGLHGVGTAPAFFDPDPKVSGNEIVYFTVASMGTPGSANAANIRDGTSVGNFPDRVQSGPEQIYLFALIDTTTDYTCGTSGTYVVKWATGSFPDPDVAEWTDYPIEVGAGTDGTFPPYVSKPSDIVPYPPEDDLLPDYRDSVANDNQQNQVRADIFKSFFPQALAPAVVKILYRDSNGKLTENRGYATDDSKADPIINIYLMYATVTRSHNPDTNVIPYWGDSVTYRNADNSTGGNTGTGWGEQGDRKQIAAQARVAAVRDWVVKSDDPNKAVNGWDWTAPKSRFPTLKWVYRVVGNDPDQTDQRPPQGYGEYTWDTYFCQQIAPMVRVADKNQDRRLWQNVTGAGELNLYPVIYPSFKNVGFPYGSGNSNDTSNGHDGPSTAEGAVSDFSGDIWTDARVGMMAIRDTWEDYLQGNQTNPLFTQMVPMANPSWSNPVEPYWTHTDTAAPDAIKYKHPAYTNMTTIQYNATLGAPYSGPNPGKIGFPRPYLWWEALWSANVKNATPEKPWGMDQQGWAGLGLTGDDSQDTDVEGETAAICNKCLGGDGLLVFVLNHDLDTSREDLRVHGINATTGIHQWDFHVPASLSGDNANGTPAIANNKVFVGYTEYGAESSNIHRRVHLVILNSDNGRQLQDTVVDDDADAIILPPMIANGVAYVGSLDHGGTTDFSDDVIRIFAMSPMLRLESTGIYPMSYRDRALVNYTSMLMDKDIDRTGIMKYAGKLQTSRRKLQVLVSGGGGKWQEVRDEVTP